ncbi:MAG: phosphoenolpyruvate carboxykinase (ATP), partial [Acidocella sp.]|nr:phosphoenolpyruvate carboxykinase (ATP) [Acidocella sp.]
DKGSFRRDPFFGLGVPEQVADVPTEVLDPRSAWADKAAYDKAAADLVRQFEENFATFSDLVGDDVKAAAIRAAA